MIFIIIIIVHRVKIRPMRLNGKKKYTKNETIFYRFERESDCDGGYIILLNTNT